MCANLELGFERLTEFVTFLDIAMMANDGSGLRRHLFYEFNELAAVTVATKTVYCQDLGLDGHSNCLALGAHGHFPESLLHPPPKGSLGLISDEAE